MSRVLGVKVLDMAELCHSPEWWRETQHDMGFETSEAYHVRVRAQLDEAYKPIVDQLMPVASLQHKRRLIKQLMLQQIAALHYEAEGGPVLNLHFINGVSCGSETEADKVNHTTGNGRISEQRRIVRKLKRLVSRLYPELQ